ncbi:hypothetical protein EDB80DRAFT_596143 [Ilyonectria destructans]|nr:hypothetical protein EDB80DRAFT_596143 [Ilyonectria destructans]
MAPGTPKKRKTDTIIADADLNDATPRPRPSTLYHGDVSDTASLSSQSQSRTPASGRSSPTKLYPFLPLDPDGLEIMPMDLDHADMPDSLARLVEDIEAIGAGQQVVHASLKVSITQLKAASRSFSSFRDSVYTTDHDNPSSPASPERFLQDILKIVADAYNCQLLEQDETGWNHLVHTPLLDAILNRQLETSNLVSFTPCMAASIIPAYRINSVPGTRVDYAMCVNPDYDAQPGVRNAIQDLRRNSREASVNHTGFAPLRNRLASVSIETKRYGGHERKAEFQLGIWQSAQWKLLSEKAGPDVPELLSFIPGIVVQGHEWKLVATTYKGGKTKLWTSRLFGSTQTALGTFQIVAGVARLRRWSTEEYWPWYKAHVLRLGSQNTPTTTSTLVTSLEPP